MTHDNLVQLDTILRAWLAAAIKHKEANRTTVTLSSTIERYKLLISLLNRPLTNSFKEQFANKTEQERNLRYDPCMYDTAGQL